MFTKEKIIRVIELVLVSVASILITYLLMSKPEVKATTGQAVEKEYLTTEKVTEYKTPAYIPEKLESLSTGLLTNQKSIKDLDTKYEEYAKTTGEKFEKDISAVIDKISAMNKEYGNYKTETEKELTNINGRIDINAAGLGDCKISYNSEDGHFYITYGEGEKAVTKKLDYVD
ncbi:MAG: hypothetical protein E7241_03970 [Lachnospiraceae bacterium]|nr:hypothetical protein [Lachnospiraceae bacterium]